MTQVCLGLGGYALLQIAPWAIGGLALLCLLLGLAWIFK